MAKLNKVTLTVLKCLPSEVENNQIFFFFSKSPRILKRERFLTPQLPCDDFICTDRTHT